MSYMRLGWLKLKRASMLCVEHRCPSMYGVLCCRVSPTPIADFRLQLTVLLSVRGESEQEIRPISAATLVPSESSGGMCCGSRGAGACLTFVRVATVHLVSVTKYKLFWFSIPFVGCGMVASPLHNAQGHVGLAACAERWCLLLNYSP